MRCKVVRTVIFHSCSQNHTSGTCRSSFLGRCEMMQKYLGLTLWCVFAMTAHAQAQQQNSYYVFDGQKVRPVHDNPPDAQYRKWQVWLYEEPVTMPRNTTSLPYSRWGAIEASSA